METTIHKSVVIGLAIASLLFLIAAFLPISKVYTEPLLERKIDYIQQMPGMWKYQQILFIAGSMITSLMLIFQALNLKNIPNSNLAMLGSIAILIGAILWGWHACERIIDPQGFANGQNTAYLFLLYSMLTQIGIALFGIALLQSDIPNWIGWMLIIGASLIFLIIIIAGDMPPFVYYLLTLIMSIGLLVKQDVL